MVGFESFIWWGVQKQRKTDYTGESPLNVNMSLLFSFILQEAGLFFLGSIASLPGCRRGGVEGPRTSSIRKTLGTGMDREESRDRPLKEHGSFT